MLQDRSCGVLLHISSLPGNTGIGTLGKEARAFVDYLKDAGQSYWQILPICPTSYGDSPYQSFSTFAGNPYFIDLDTLVREGFLEAPDLEGVKWCEREDCADYGILFERRGEIFSRLHESFKKKIPADFDTFCAENKFWLDDYSLFMAVKDAHGGKEFGLWEDGIRRRAEAALREWREKSAERIQYHKMLQYFFYRQWFSLKEYANSRGIKIIGDIPIYVAADSSDVWASPEQFALDGALEPKEVAGCPPDAFSADGQLWGNPVYDWERMEADGFSWWKRRLEKSLSFYDVLRIDHFRGFDSYYCIPFGARDAKEGVWRKGPGMKLFRALRDEFGELPVIAEDLGFLTESVRSLLAESGFPGMKILQFAFDSREESDYLPYKYPRNCVVYTGTHDNDTILGWTKTASERDVNSAMEYLRAKDADGIREEMMVCAMSSVADTCILSMQDLLGLGSEARMNTPSTVGANWKWRAKAGAFTNEIRDFLYGCAKTYGRLPLRQTQGAERRVP